MVLDWHLRGQEVLGGAKHVWAERFDRDLADIFALQDEITQSVVGAVEPEMQIVEGRRATRKSAGNLDAFDCWMRGVWHFHHLSDAEQHREAETWYRRAIEIDPRFSPAHMGSTRGADRPVSPCVLRQVRMRGNPGGTRKALIVSVSKDARCGSRFLGSRR